MAYSAPTLHLNAWKGSLCAEVLLGTSSPWISDTFSGVWLSCCHIESSDRLQLSFQGRSEGKVLISSSR